MNYAEQVAKRIVEQLVRGGEMTFCDQQDASHHDFDLRYANGVVVPVEVTMSANPSHIETVSAIQDQGAHVSRRRCTDDWQIYPVIGANIKNIRRSVDDYLA